MIEPFLEELENRLDPQTEEALEAEWNRFLDRRFDGGIFRPRRRAAAPARLEWSFILINHALRDPELLLLRELRSVSDTLAAGSGNLLNIRCNYGTSILPSLFGVEPFYLDDDCDTLPTSMPLADGRDGIRRLVDAGVPPLDRGLAPKVFDTAAFSGRGSSRIRNCGSMSGSTTPICRGRRMLRRWSGAAVFLWNSMTIPL